MKSITAIVLALFLSACALPQPVPQYAVDSCLASGGNPVFETDGWGSTTFTCDPNDARNSLNARYFDDPRLIEYPEHYHEGEGG